MPIPLDEIRAIIADAVAPRHFFIGNGLELEWEHTAAETIQWEIYKGRLLDASQTRERRTFEAWNIYGIDEFGRSTEPLLSVKLDAETGEVHVVRAILCYAWEAYEASPNVIESRETTKWVRELVGTIEISKLTTSAQSTERISDTLFRAVIGTSRLPLVSVEAPLPTFSLGRLAYLCRFHMNLAETRPRRTWREIVGMRPLGINSLPTLEHTKLLETLLCVVPWGEITEAADAWFACLLRIEKDRLETIKARVEAQLGRTVDETDAGVKAYLDAPSFSRRLALLLLHALFNEASLTPYNDLVDKALAWIGALESKGHFSAEFVAGFLSHLLRQLGRHLTAYDLVAFHHRGANYPDAIVLDAVMKSYLKLIDREPALFASAAQDDEREANLKRLRRRALRQGWLARRRYEGHFVPDAPTSPGENSRVLPPPYVRVPEEQILNPTRRTKRLYAGDPLDSHLGKQPAEILQQSIDDLRHPDEMRELGMAIFLDRPFGGGKGPPEADRTPLLSYLAFSRSIARDRLRFMVSDLGLLPHSIQWETLQETLEVLKVPGVPLKDLVSDGPPGIVSLADALRIAEDFIVLRNTWSSWMKIRTRYLNLSALHRLWMPDIFNCHSGLIVRTTRPGCARETLSLYDIRHRKRLELDFDPNMGFVSEGGFYYPASPLHIVRVWEPPGPRRAVDGKEIIKGMEGPLTERDLSSEPILLQPPRW